MFLELLFRKLFQNNKSKIFQLYNDLFENYGTFYKTIKEIIAMSRVQ